MASKRKLKAAVYRLVMTLGVDPNDFVSLTATPDKVTVQLYGHTNDGQRAYHGGEPIVIERRERI